MTSVSIDIHRDLIESCKRGEETGFHQLYKLYSRAMYNAALRIVKDDQEAEDVLQEAFISAFRNIQSYKGDSTFGAWLKRIVVNRAISELRKNKGKHLNLDDSEEVEEVIESYQPVNYDIGKLKTAIKDLPDGYRLVLSLYLLEGYDHQEIAEILDISVSTSKSQYNRAKAKLRTLIDRKEVYYG